MTRIRRFVGVVAVFTLLALPGQATGDPVTFGNRIAFTAAFGTTLVDDYSHPGYRVGDVGNSDTIALHSNDRMSSVLGETRYEPTGGPGHVNIVLDKFGDAKYCAGCNGSFLLTFDRTSIGGAGGVLGVGIDLANSRRDTYGAAVTFGDGSVRQFALPSGAGPGIQTPRFWGIAAPELIYSIHVGPDLGASSSNLGTFVIDNLTLGGGRLAPVPEPASMLLLVTGGAFIGRRVWSQVRTRPSAKQEI
jgi:hypothetical protein